jgi:hypothetical protein
MFFLFATRFLTNRIAQILKMKQNQFHETRIILIRIIAIKGQFHRNFTLKNRATGSACKASVAERVTLRVGA